MKTVCMHETEIRLDQSFKTWKHSKDEFIFWVLHDAFISKISTPVESFKAKQVYFFQHFSFYEQSKFYTQLS